MPTYFFILACFFVLNFCIHKTRRDILMATMVDAAVLAICAVVIELVSRI